MKHVEILLLLLALSPLLSDTLYAAQTTAQARDPAQVLEELASLLDEPYRHGYAREEILNLLDEANRALRDGNATEEILSLLEDAERIHEGYLEEKPIILLGEALAVLSPIIVSATVYYGLKYAPCLLDRILTRIKKVVCHGRRG